MTLYINRLTEPGEIKRVTLGKHNITVVLRDGTEKRYIAEQVPNELSDYNCLDAVADRTEE